MNSLIKLETRVRLVIQNEFRETLDLNEGDNVQFDVEKGPKGLAATNVSKI